MNERIREIFGKKRTIVLLIGMLAIAGLMWFFLLGGASAAPGLLGSDTGGGDATQQEKRFSIGTCIFPGIPC